jgi:hypothetical protein
MSSTATPAFPPKTFHRIRPTHLQALERMIKERSTGIVSPELAKAFGLGHGLIVASGSDVGPAQIFALGIVTEKAASGERVVEWKAVQMELAVTGMQGGSFWTQLKPTFKFADTVAEGFGLKGIFEKNFGDPFAARR